MRLQAVCARIKRGRLETALDSRGNGSVALAGSRRVLLAFAPDWVVRNAGGRRHAIRRPGVADCADRKKARAAAMSRASLRQTSTGFPSPSIAR